MSDQEGYSLGVYKAGPGRWGAAGTLTATAGCTRVTGQRWGWPEGGRKRETLGPPPTLSPRPKWVRGFWPEGNKLQ